MFDFLGFFAQNIRLTLIVVCYAAIPSLRVHPGAYGSCLRGHLGLVKLHGRTVEDQLQPMIGSALAKVSNEFKSQSLDAPKVH